MMSDNKDQPPRKRAVKKKTRVDDIEDIEKKETPKKKRSPRVNRKKMAERLIRDALESHLEYQAVKKTTEKQDLHFLTSVIEEYLENFIILGYNYHGDPVQLVSTGNQQQADALGTSIHRFIMKNLSGGNGPAIF
jgi:phenylalanyl-tRNA synthetase alpha subunit